MKKTKGKFFLTVVILLAVFVFSGVAMAENEKVNKSSTTPRKAETRAETRVRFMKNLEGKFGDKIDKLDKIALRVGERMKALELKGYLMSDSKNLMEEANLRISAAKKSLTELKSAIVSATMFQTNNPNSSVISKLAIIRTEGKKTRDAIKIAHRSLVKVIASIKQGLRKGKTATTTPAVSTDSATTSISN